MDGIGSGSSGSGIGSDGIDLSGYMTNPATADLDMANFDILMGTGGIGNDEPLITFGAGATGASTFAGNILLGANGIGGDNPILTFAGGAAGDSTFAGDVDIDGNMLYMSATRTAYMQATSETVIAITTGGIGRWEFNNNYIYAANAYGAALYNAASTSTSPVHTFRGTTGLKYGLGGDPASGYISTIANNLEVQRITSEKAVHVPEITTPTPVANYGSVYPKADNLFYGQDGAGVEHELSYSAEQLAEMFMYEATQTITINTANVYHAVFGYSTGTVDNFTFAAGSQIDANILNEIDATALQIETSAAHGLVTGDVVTLSNMNNLGHNGATVITYVDATNFTCDDIVYVAGAGASAGVVDQPSSLTAGTGAAGEYAVNGSISGTSAANAKQFKWELFINATEQNHVVAERKHAVTDMGTIPLTGDITIADGDIVWLACNNKTDTTNFVIEHSNVNLHRL